MSEQATGGDVRARYERGLEQVRRGVRQLVDLHAELEAAEAHASVRATLLKLVHALDEALLRDTHPTPDFGPDEDGAPERPIAPHVEAGERLTQPEAGG